MMLVEEALRQVLAAVSPLEPVDVPLAEAFGLVLAADVRSTLEIPPLDNSAMDGYAVRSADLSAASSSSVVILPVIGEIAAGSPPEPAVRAGTAIRIMTGAPVPPGADAVVRFEDTDEEDRRSRGGTLDEIGIRVAVTSGTSVRRAGFRTFILFPLLCTCAVRRVRRRVAELCLELTCVVWHVSGRCTG